MEQYPEWFESSVERRKISEGPLGVGTKYHGVEKMPGRTMEFTLEITAFQPHRLMAAKLSPPVNATWTATFEPMPDGTRMTLRSVAELTGIMGWLAPLLKGWAAKTQQKGLNKFKSSVEVLSD